MLNQKLTELAADVLGPEALRPANRVVLPAAALARQLDRGRHHRRDEEHRRRARARPPETALAGTTTWISASTTSSTRSRRRPARCWPSAPHCRPSARRPSRGPTTDALWSEIRDLGWPGIAIAEEHGGQGLGMVELVILAEELGYACAPTPFLSNAIAGLVIDSAGQRRAARSLASRHRLRRGPGLDRRHWRRARTGPGRRGRRRDRAGPDDGAAAGRGIGGEDRAGRADRRDARVRAGERRRRRAARWRRCERPPARGSGAGRRAGRARPARNGDGRRLREGAPAVRSPDRRLPGGLAPAARGCSTTSRRPARSPTTRPGAPAPSRESLPLAAHDGQGARLRRRLARHQRRAPGPSAASASPGSTTCTSSSSARRSARSSWATHACTASRSRR